MTDSCSSTPESGLYYEVQQGDNLSLIALIFGFKDHTAIYDHPKNTQLKAQRPNPDILFPGDMVFIPKRVKEQPCATDKRWRFVRGRPKKILRIIVEDSEGTALSDSPYELAVDRTQPIPGRLEGSPQRTFRGNTGNAGLIEQAVPLNATRATLKVGSFVRDLQIGYLNPPEKTDDQGVSGIQARLANLGYDPGPIDGILGPRTEAAIRAFQAKHQPLKVDGICGPKTLAVLIRQHKS
jgi:N-acetylmuramoyl-L-alanine amidase